MSKLTDRLRASVAKHRNLPAVEVGEKQISYSELESIADRLTMAIDEVCVSSTIGIFGQKSFEQYVAVLGSVFSGKTFVPLHPGFPVDRTLSMIEQSEMDTIIVLPEAMSRSEEMSLSQTLNLISISVCDDSFNLQVQQSENSSFASKFVDNNLIYLLFTSGSTGVPKGVGVTEKNLLTYLDHIIETYPLSSSDRCSQTFDLTFDLSMHDIFVTWLSGACLCSLTPADLFFPGHAIKAKALSVWFSVPSLAINMDQMGQLSPEYLGSLRLSLFCGEALPESIAQKWLNNASGSKVVNLYGPTEATIAILEHDCKYLRDLPPQTGVVPIGKPFETAKAKIEDEELLVGGNQVTPGYWKNPEKTASVFVERDGEVWYRTGDRVDLEADTYLFRGRIDFQVKINGFRIELGEIETRLRETSSHSNCVVLPSPFGKVNPDSLIAYIEAESIEKDEKAAILEKLANELPPYMVPSDILAVAKFPLNSNGKIDRKGLSGLFPKPD